MMKYPCSVCERRLGAYESGETTCVSFSYSLPTCASAATLGSTDGICPSFAGWSECSEQDVSDVAVTSGECKSYWYAFAILTDGSPRAAACEIAVSVAVDARGSLSFPQATAAVTIDVAVDGETTTYVVGGASGDVDAALAEVSFCPRCVDETYSLTFELTSPCAACDTNAGDGKVMTVYAATALSRTFAGRVVASGCGADCWDAGLGNVSVVVDAPGDCDDRRRRRRLEETGAYVGWDDTAALTAPDGTYAVVVPYQASSHGANATVRYDAPGYRPEAARVVLGAVAVAPEAGRYYWQSDAAGDSCVDGSTLDDVPAARCAAAGVDMCAVFADKFRPYAGSFCQCWLAARFDARSADLGTCAGSPRFMNASACAELGVAGANCTGYPCACATASVAGAGAHVVDAVYLTSTSTPPSAVPLSAPTTARPSYFPTAVPTSRPTSAPTSSPSSLPTTPPAPSPSLQPSPLPTTAVPTSVPTACPSPEPSQPVPTQDFPTYQPSMNPTYAPTSTPQPTATPSSPAPTTSGPTLAPVKTPPPTDVPTSSTPTLAPSVLPTTAHSSV